MRKIRNYYGETYDFNTHIRVCLYTSIVRKYGLPKADTLKLDRLHNNSIVAGLHKHWSRKRLAQFDYTTLFDRPELKKNFQQECLSVFKYNEQQSLPTLSERWKHLRRNDYREQQSAEHFEENSQVSDTNVSLGRKAGKADAKKWLQFYATRTEQDLPTRPDRRQRSWYAKETYVSQHPKHSRRRKSHKRIRDVYSSSSSVGENEESPSRIVDERGRSRDRNVRISSLGHLDSFTEDYRTAPSAQTYRPKSRNRSINRNHRGHQQSLGYEERDNDGDYWEFDLNEPMDNSVLQFHQQFTYADNGFFQHDDRSFTRYPRARKRSPLVRRRNRRWPNRRHASKFLDRHRQYLRSCVASSTLRTRYPNSQSRRRSRRSSSYSSDRTRIRSPSRWQHDLFSDISSTTYSPMCTSDDSWGLSWDEEEVGDAEEEDGEGSSAYSKLLNDYTQYKRRAKLFRYRHRWDDLRHKLDRRNMKNKFRRRYGPD